MKKLLLSLTAMVLLSACASTGLKEDKVLYTVNGIETKDSDIYKSMKLGDDGTVIINNARKEMIANAEVNEDVLNTQVAKNIAELEAMFGDNLLPYIQNFGFTTIEEFIEKQVKPSVVLETLAREQLTKDKDTLISTYKYKTVEYIAGAKKDVIEAALVSINNGAKMSEIELDESTKFSSETFTKSSTVPSKTLDTYLKADQKEGLSDILFDEESNLYFIVNNIAVDLETTLDTIMDTIIQKENYMTQFSGNFFIQNGFKVYDKKLSEKMKKTHPQYIK